MTPISVHFVNTVSWFFINCLRKKKEIEDFIIEIKPEAISNKKFFDEHRNLLVDMIDEADDVFLQISYKDFLDELEQPGLTKLDLICMSNESINSIHKAEYMCLMILEYLEGFMSFVGVGEPWIDELKRQYKYILFVGKEFKNVISGSRERKIFDIESKEAKQ